jgi:hypothetical protein
MTTHRRLVVRAGRDVRMGSATTRAEPLVHVNTAGRVLCLNGPAENLLLHAEGPQGTVIVVQLGSEKLKYRIVDCAVGSAQGWARGAEFAQHNRYL